jgi:hypothetical protein
VVSNCETKALKKAKKQKNSGSYIYRFRWPPVRIYEVYVKHVFPYSMVLMEMEEKRSQFVALIFLTGRPGTLRNTERCTVYNE